MTLLLLTLPWLGLLVFVRFFARVPSELPPADAIAGQDAPSVSVIVPARNEVANIERCLRSLAAYDYPHFEVIVVDDRSEDDTARLAAEVPAGRADRIEVVRGEELPDGWFGKPWACHQGAARATGDVLLFTDADTVHGPNLLRRAVAGLHEEEADLLTVVGRQLMESFWERLIQPQVFLVMFLRFPDFEKTAKNDRWRDAIANGQFILMPRASYDAIGGHEAVRGEVAEDLMLAQHVKRAGMALRIRSAEDDLSTRMYQSLGHIIEGWSKNVFIGGAQSLPAFLRPVLPLLSIFVGVGLWIVPPLVLLASILGYAGPAALTWSAVVCGLSVGVFALFTRAMGGPAWYGSLYWLGAAMGAYIFARSWARGRNVEWKGRRYSVDSVTDLA